MVGRVLMRQSRSQLSRSGSVQEARTWAPEIRGSITRCRQTRRVERHHLDTWHHRTSGISRRRWHGALDRRTTSGAVRMPELSRHLPRPSLQRMASPMTQQPSLIPSTPWRWIATSGTRTARTDHRECPAGRTTQLDQEATTKGNDNTTEYETFALSETSTRNFLCYRSV